MSQQETLKLEFRNVITLGTGENPEKYTHVELREPTAADLEKAQRADTPVGAVINMVSAIGNVPRLVAEKMCSRDITRANKFLSSFQDGPDTAADGPN